MQGTEREWHDRRVSQLYTMALAAKYEIVRKEVLKALGVLQRVGNEEAACAIEDIKKEPITIIHGEDPNPCNSLVFPL
jgi:hypothetical protein